MVYARSLSWWTPSIFGGPCFEIQTTKWCWKLQLKDVPNCC